jgi:hypothetical protein
MSISNWIRSGSLCELQLFNEGFLLFLIKVGNLVIFHFTAIPLFKGATSPHLVPIRNFAAIPVPVHWLAGVPEESWFLVKRIWYRSLLVMHLNFINII